MALPGVQSEADVTIPLLEDVFKLFARELLINIEVKTPKTVALRPNYDSDRLIRVLHDSLQRLYNSEQQTMETQQLMSTDFSFISSFDHEWMERY